MQCSVVFCCSLSYKNCSPTFVTLFVTLPHPVSWLYQLHIEANTRAFLKAEQIIHWTCKLGNDLYNSWLWEQFSPQYFFQQLRKASVPFWRLIPYCNILKNSHSFGWMANLIKEASSLLIHFICLYLCCHILPLWLWLQSYALLPRAKSPLIQWCFFWVNMCKIGLYI